MDLTQLANTPRPVALAGRAYPVRQLKLREWAGLHAWLRASAANPLTLALKAIEEAKASGAPPSRELADRLVALAYSEARSWPPPVGSGAWLSALDRADGGTARFVAAALAAGGTALADGEADDLAEAATPAELAELVRVCYFGGPPEPPAPPKKAEAPAAAPGPPPSPTTGAPSPPA